MGDPPKIGVIEEHGPRSLQRVVCVIGVDRRRTSALACRHSGLGVDVSNRSKRASRKTPSSSFEAIEPLRGRKADRLSRNGAVLRR